MRYIEAFSKEHESNYTIFDKGIDGHSVFLAGGISNCEDWQSQIIKYLEKTNLVVINPRRSDFDITNTNESVKQIEWEHRHLKLADYILFWFPQETLCPITLFEYGKWLVSNKFLIVGCHSEYKRKLDVIEQTKLERPNMLIYDNLKDLAIELIFLDRLTKFGIYNEVLDRRMQSKFFGDNE